MNTKLIKELLEIMNSANLKALEVCEGETKVRLEKNVAGQGDGGVDHGGHYPQANNSNPGQHLRPPDQKSEVVDFNKLTEVRSPLVGVFYAAASPDSPPFAKIGQKIKKGDVLCIVEAMKQMNEIVAEASGEIADVCVKNGDIVEYNQVLFKIY